MSLSINDIRTLLALGLYTSGSGVAFPTLQTIGAYTGQGTAGNQAALRRLIDKGYIRKLQPKWYAGQTSQWLTDRYQVLYSKNDPVPTKEQLQESKAFNIHSLEPQGTNSKEELIEAYKNWSGYSDGVIKEFDGHYIWTGISNKRKCDVINNMIKRYGLTEVTCELVQIS